MKNNKIYPKPESIKEAFDRLTSAWKAKDFDTCKPLLNYICENMAPNELEDLFLQGIDAAMGIFELFVKTGLDNVLEETPARAFYLRLVGYIIKNETPDFKQASKEAFNHFFPDLKPVGFKKNGDRLYSLNTLAKGLGVTMEELLSEAQKMPDVELFSTELPEDVTIHQTTENRREK